MLSKLVRVKCAAFLSLFFVPFPGLAADNGPTVQVPNLFSYHAPMGWAVQTLPSATYPAATETKDGTVRGMITVEVDHVPGPLREWCQNSMKRNTVQLAQYGYHPGELTPFETTAGIKGFRIAISLTANGKDISSIDYFFTGSSDAKLVISCGCTKADVPHYAPIFDAASKTFIPY